MSQKGRIFFILYGCLFFAGGVFPWASTHFGLTVENYKGNNETLLYLTGGIMLVIGLMIPRNHAKIISFLGSMIGLGWGVYISLLLITYILNPPHFAQNSYAMNLEPGLFLTMGACFLSVSYGIFKLRRFHVNK